MLKITLFQNILTKKYETDVYMFAKLKSFLKIIINVDLININY